MKEGWRFGVEESEVMQPRFLLTLLDYDVTFLESSSMARAFLKFVALRSLTF